MGDAQVRAVTGHPDHSADIQDETALSTHPTAAGTPWWLQTEARTARFSVA
jgi:hypothetical protein